MSRSFASHARRRGFGKIDVSRRTLDAIQAQADGAQIKTAMPPAPRWPSVEVRVILDFGAGFIDWRGWYQNAGA